MKGVEAPEGEKAKAAVADAVSASASSQQTSDDLESAPVEVLPVAKAEKPEEEKTSDEAEVWEKVRLIRTKALALLESWSTLAEVFKIPRKVLRAEHEREAEEAEAKAAHSRLSLASENPSASSGSPSVSGVHMTENRKRSYERSRGDYHHHARPQVRHL